MPHSRSPATASAYRLRFLLPPGTRCSIAAHDDDGLHYLGRVGTGFDEEALRSLRSSLDRRARKTPALTVPAAESRDAHWVRPDLVGEVRFSGLTEAGRLRHPVWRGLRSDIDAEDVRV